MKKLKEFQVSYQTLLFMAKIKEYAFGCCSMSEEAPYNYYNEPLNDKAVKVIGAIQDKANNFFLMSPLRRHYSYFFICVLTSAFYFL